VDALDVKTAKTTINRRFCKRKLYKIISIILVLFITRLITSNNSIFDGSDQNNFFCCGNIATALDQLKRFIFTLFKPSFETSQSLDEEMEIP
jgi:hypothetical protein